MSSRSWGRLLAPTSMLFLGSLVLGAVVPSAVLWSSKGKGPCFCSDRSKFRTTGGSVSHCKGNVELHGRFHQHDLVASPLRDLTWPRRPEDPGGALGTPQRPEGPRAVGTHLPLLRPYLSDRGPPTRPPDLTCPTG